MLRKAHLPPPNLPKGGALQRRPPAYLLYSKAYLLGHLYFKAYLFAVEEKWEWAGQGKIVSPSHCA